MAKRRITKRWLLNSFGIILLILIAPSGKNIPPHDDTRQYITFMSDNQYRKETKIARYKGVFLMREILS